MAFCELNRYEDCFPEVVETAITCPVCGGDKEYEALLCDRCQMEVVTDFLYFLSGRDKTQIKYLDSLLDGTSLEEFIKTHGG